MIKIKWQKDNKITILANLQYQFNLKSINNLIKKKLQVIA